LSSLFHAGKHKTTLLTTLGAIVVIVFLTYGMLEFISGFSLSGIVGFFSSLVGKDLQTDNYNHTNILLLGVGGEGHIGENLTDTVIVASVDTSESFVTLISIPRDLYLETSKLNGSRVNKIYELGVQKHDKQTGMDMIMEAAGTITGLPMHYYVKIDFKGFGKIIDGIGGVDLYVDETINDPLYPKDGTYDYEPFYLPAGNRHLDGETALKYVRSRQTSSDFERSYRQQKLLMAIKDKVRDKKIATDVKFLQKMYHTLEGNVETNLELRELISLSDIGAAVREESILNVSIHDDPSRRGGFLYSPLRALYGGAYVLLPAGDDFKYVQHFMKLAAYYHDEIKNPTKIQILNGTKVAGLAVSTKTILRRFGFDVIRFGNGRDKSREKTVFYYKNKENPPDVLSILQTLIPAETSAEIPAEYLEDEYKSDAEVIIELGSDYLTTFNTLDIFRNIVPLITESPAKPPEESAPSASGTPPASPPTN